MTRQPPGLSGKKYEELQNALLNAFPSRNDLAQMVRTQLGRNLDTIADGNNLKSVVFRLIEVAEAEGWTEELVKKAHLYNHGNRLLRQFTEQFFGSVIPKSDISYIQILNDGFRVLDNEKQEHHFPKFVPCFSVSHYQEALQTLPYWQTVLDLIRRVHKYFLPARQYLTSYEAIRKIAKRQTNPEEFMRGFLPDAYEEVSNFILLCKDIAAQLETLPPVMCTTTPIQVLTKLPICMEAIKRSIQRSLSGEETEFQVAMNLFEAIEQWLVHTIHISEIILEQGRNGESS